MKMQIRFGAVLLLAGLLAACASTSQTKPGDQAPAPGAQTSPATPQKSAAELQAEAKKAEEDMKRQQLLSEETIYFEFDSANIDQQSRAVIEAHAIYLVENPDLTVNLEGHCDERGTREYNLALGERRSQSVQKLMIAAGAPAEQIKVVSFGEEKPADPGHDEAAWRKNRRVELVYKSKGK